MVFVALSNRHRRTYHSQCPGVPEPPEIPLGKTRIAAFTVVLAASFFSWGFITGPQLERPIKRTVVDDPLSSLARVTDASSDTLLLKLKAHGIVATGQQSVRDVSTEYPCAEFGLYIWNRRAR